jgi:DNA invertase Pin-like site-specific DNA recombinase
MSIKCQCGREREAVKADVIKLIQGGSAPAEIVRILGCTRQYVHQLQRELAIAQATAAQMKIPFTSPFPVHDRN